MIAVVIIVLAVLVVAAIVWARVSAARSENRSVETYEHALGVLGEVSKRTEHHGFRILSHEETGRPHVGRRIDPAGGETTEEREDAGMRAQGQLVSRRLPPAGEPKLRVSRPAGAAGAPAPGEDEAAQVHAGDEAATGETGAPPGAGAPARVSPAPPRSPAPSPRPGVYRSEFDRRRQVLARRAATGLAAAAAVVAVIVAALYLSGGGNGHHGATGSSTTTTLKRGGGQTTTSTSQGGRTTTTTTLSNALRPTSTSPLSFTVPTRDYTMVFQASGGRCWVGIEHATTGPWLFAQTMAAGQSATFKGSGKLVVTLGAPAHFSLTVNGLVAELPRGVTQVYSFYLTPPAT